MIDTERNAMYQQLLDDIRKKKAEISAVVDPLIEKLEALAAEERSIVRLMAGTVTTKKITKISSDGPKRGKYAKNVVGKILSMLETGEFSVSELCEKFGLDSESYRTYFSNLYRLHKIGRRSFLSGRAYFYKYATEEWYKSQGITDYALHKNWVSETK